jgi:UDP-N-acetylmuramate-alanine ligase
MKRSLFILAGIRFVQPHQPEIHSTHTHTHTHTPKREEEKVEENNVNNIRVLQRADVLYNLPRARHRFHETGIIL